MSDTRLATVLSLALFVLAAWPLLLVEVPPLQDLPNHLATATVLRHLDEYPELRSNGFFKTNSALFVWLVFAGRALGAHLAAKLFVAFALAANAFMLPRLVLRFAGRRAAVTSSLLAWPMVHHWFVSTGMLDYALALPMSVGILVFLHDKKRLLAALLALATWYVHAFPLVIVDVLLAIRVATRVTWAERRAAAFDLIVPMIPAGLLVMLSASLQLGEGATAMTGFVSHRAVIPTWEIVYNAWAEWTYGFTWLSITSIVPSVLLAYYGFKNALAERSFFSYCGFGALVLAYVLAPYIATNWFYVGTRIVPFVFYAALVRTPESLPRPLISLLAACAILYSAGMGVDYVRLDRDRAAFTAGIEAVPEHATLLPLVFRQKVTAENTRSVLHDWGFYVEAKHTSAPLLFAHSKSFPVIYTAPPPTQFNHLVLENFAPSMRDSGWMCKTLREGGVALEDCDAAWRERWAALFREAAPLYDHVLMWSAPPAVRALVPKTYQLALERGDLAIYRRVGTAAAEESPLDLPPKRIDKLGSPLER